MKCNEYWSLILNWKSELDLNAMGTPVPIWRFILDWNKSWWENQFSFWEHFPFFQESEHWVSTHDMESHSPGEHRQFFSWMVAHGTDVVKAIALFKCSSLWKDQPTYSLIAWNLNCMMIWRLNWPLTESWCDIHKVELQET